jgi:hypothetical protein
MNEKKLCAELEKQFLKHQLSFTTNELLHKFQGNASFQFQHPLQFNCCHELKIDIEDGL